MSGGSQDVRRARHTRDVWDEDELVQDKIPGDLKYFIICILQASYKVISGQQL